MILLSKRAAINVLENLTRVCESMPDTQDVFLLLEEADTFDLNTWIVVRSVQNSVITTADGDNIELSVGGQIEILIDDRTTNAMVDKILICDGTTADEIKRILLLVKDPSGKYYSLDVMENVDGWAMRKMLPNIMC